MSGRQKVEERLKQVGLPLNPTTGESYIEKWDNSLSGFSQAIEDDYNKNKQTVEELNKKLDILEEIERYLGENVLNNPINGKIYKLKAVVPFGSSASGLGVKGGDLDMTICVYPPVGQKRKEVIRSRSNDILRVILNHIKSRKMLGQRKLRDVHLISLARVPIITGFIDDVEVDISISMTYVVSAQYLSAKYIEVYTKFDRRFVVLAAFVKQWQKKMKTEINEDFYKKVFPSSCSTVLLVVFFMKHYGMLPNITGFSKDQLGQISTSWKDINNEETVQYSKSVIQNWKKENQFNVSLGTLFLLFLDFYTNVVDFAKHRIYIGSGKFEKKARRHSKTRMVIMDVIDKDNPAKSVCEIPTLRKMYSDAKAVLMKCGISKDLKSKLFSMSLPSPIEIHVKKMEERLMKVGSISIVPGERTIESCDKAFEKFSDDIEKCYVENKVDPTEKEKKADILKSFKIHLQNYVFHNKIEGVSYELKAVVPIGSSFSDLGMCDIDLKIAVCVYPLEESTEVPLKKRKSNEVLFVVFNSLQVFSSVEKVKMKSMKYNSTTTNPFINGFFDDLQVEIIVSMDETVPVEYMSFKLIEVYEKYDRRFIVLSSFVVQWLESKRTSGAINEHYYNKICPDSYSAVLMVIFFMKHYGMLPNINSLHDDKLELHSVTWKMVNQGENGAIGVSNEEVNMWRDENACEVSLGTLFLLFLDFYTEVINLRVQTLSIRTGQPFKDGQKKQSITISDVFDDENPAERVTEIETFKRLLLSARRMVRSHPKIDMKKNLFTGNLSTFH